ncbi:MAG: septum formation initiator family protein [Alphaproteobacteria bacterium]|nr:MAG: septum formation initiator family protein [Alphaproteobacteria bacterium]
MTQGTGSPGFFPFVYFSACLVATAYFAFAAVQGDFGLFRRIQLEAEIATERTELSRLEARRDFLRNKTRRLSDAWLDLDLLDEEARRVLGYIRADEIVVR